MNFVIPNRITTALIERIPRWQSLLRISYIPGYSGPVYLGAYDWIESIRANYPDKIVMTGMEWNVPGHEHGSTGIVAANARRLDILSLPSTFN